MENSTVTSQTYCVRFSNDLMAEVDLIHHALIKKRMFGRLSRSALINELVRLGLPNVTVLLDIDINQECLR